MSIKSIAARILARNIAKKIRKWATHPVKTQKKVFRRLIAKADSTRFGIDHHFSTIKNYEDFKKSVPVRDYEALRIYIDDVVSGEKDVLWKGRPLYFAKTSGTTSGTKYIPLTRASIPYHIKAARNAILCYIHDRKTSGFVDGKMIFLQGSPVLQYKNGIKTGRLSGIVAHYVPRYLLKNRMPSWKVNCIEDWEAKIQAIVEETVTENMTVISGIPSWVQTYFEKLRAKTNMRVGELFKELQLFIYGGLNYEPYRAKFEDLIGRKIDSIELYPASEGFFAFQDSQKEKGMLLQLNSGIFYEFIRAENFTDKHPERMMIQDVEIGVNYVMIVSTNAGLWAYNTGDLVQFTSVAPYRVIVSGRIKHFISAFGEHVIASEVEHAIKEAMEGTTIQISEFTVAPQVNPENGELPYHEWFIEFEKAPEDLIIFSKKIDLSLQRQNSYYLDLIRGKILQRLKITCIKKGGFSAYMKAIGKLGGQYKIPRLSNNRDIAKLLFSSIKKHN